jgi:hypothetical protein
VANAENEQHGQRRASVGEHERVHGCGDVVPPDREAFAEEPEEPLQRVRPVERHHGGGLAHGHVVEHAKRSDHHPGHEEPLDRQSCDVELQLRRLLRSKAAEMR